MDLLTIAETAKLLKVTPTTVRRYISAGQLPAFKVGRGVRIRKEAIENFLTPVTPTCPGATAQEEGGPMRAIERTSVPLLTSEEQRQVLAAIEQGKRERAELAARYRELPVPSSVELLEEARAQRTRELA